MSELTSCAVNPGGVVTEFVTAQSVPSGVPTPSPITVFTAGPGAFGTRLASVMLTFPDAATVNE